MPPSARAMRAAAWPFRDSYAPRAPEVSRRVALTSATRATRRGHTNVSWDTGPMPYTKDEQMLLRDLAWRSIRYGFDHQRPLAIVLDTLPAPLREPRATFVTVEKRGALRGCIGTLEARTSLAQDVADHAFAAAFEDPRFPPLARDEAADVELHISILTPPASLVARDEAELLQAAGLLKSSLPCSWTGTPAGWAVEASWSVLLDHPTAHRPGSQCLGRRP